MMGVIGVTVETCSLSIISRCLAARTGVEKFSRQNAKVPRESLDSVHPTSSPSQNVRSSHVLGVNCS